MKSQPLPPTMNVNIADAIDYHIWPLRLVQVKGWQPEATWWEIFGTRENNEWWDVRIGRHCQRTATSNDKVPSPSTYCAAYFRDEEPIIKVLKKIKVSLAKIVRLEQVRPSLVLLLLVGIEIFFSKIIGAKKDS